MKRILTLVLAVAAFLAAENTADAQLLKNLVNIGVTNKKLFCKINKVAGGASNE